jgi:hypothetical protein
MLLASTQRLYRLLKPEDEHEILAAEASSECSTRSQVPTPITPNRLGANRNLGVSDAEARGIARPISSQARFENRQSENFLVQI